jgi:K+-sensing histidine kinase KdpD
MVSVRKGKQDPQPHLGLGLYIAQLIAEFHLGTVELVNNESATGVDTIVTIPSAKK